MVTIQEAISRIEVSLLHMPFPMWLSRRPPKDSGFPMMQASFGPGVHGALALHWDCFPLVKITRADLAYDAQHPAALEVLAHEVGHLIVWRREPDLLLTHQVNRLRATKLTEFLTRKVEEDAWDMAESMLKRIMGKSFDRRRFFKWKDLWLNTYPKGEHERRIDPRRLSGRGGQLLLPGSTA